MLRVPPFLIPVVVAPVFAFAALAAIAFAAPGAAVAQSLPSLAVPTPGEAVLPPGVLREGVYLTAPVVLDGATLFRVATPLLSTPDEMPVDVRADYVNEALAQIVAFDAAKRRTLYSPDNLHVSIVHDGDQVVLVANGDNQAPLNIVTVTASDAKYRGTTVDALAATWQATLQSALTTALKKRQPAEQQRSIRDVVAVATWLVVGTLFALIMAAFLRRTRRPWAEGVAVFIPWIVGVAWYATLVYGLSLFPQTAALGQSLMRSATGVAFIWLAAWATNRIVDALLPYVVRARMIQTPMLGAIAGNDADAVRSELRVPTVLRALSDFKLGVILFVALLATMSQIGIPVASVITIGGLIAIAASFAAQNIVRDVLNGFLVLAEDQYVVGDFVTIGSWSGVVEHLNVRMVQVRDANGSLVTIPHSAVVQVANQSRNWSRVDYRVPIAADADLGAAIRIVASAAEELAKDEAWSDAILGPPEWVGIQSVARGSIVVRAPIRTKPLRQFGVERELNARVLAAFEREGVKLGHGAAAPAVVVE